MSDLKPCDCNNPFHDCDERAGCRVLAKVGREQPVQAAPLHQALTDPENQPNQFGIEFLLHGPKLAFKVGAQQFTLDYEPTEPGDFEYMRDMLIHAFSTFTPDVKTAQSVPLLAYEEIEAAWHDCDDYTTKRAYFDAGVYWAQKAVRAKLGAEVGWRPIETAPRFGRILVKTEEIGFCVASAGWDNETPEKIRWEVVNGIEVTPTHWMPLTPPPGIVGKEGA